MNTSEQPPVKLEAKPALESDRTLGIAKLRYFSTRALPYDVESHAILAEGALAQKKPVNFASIADGLVMPKETVDEKIKPRIDKIIDSLKQQGVQLTPQEELIIQTGMIKKAPGEEWTLDDDRYSEMCRALNTGLGSIAIVQGRVATSTDVWLEEETKRNSPFVGDLQRIKDALTSNLQEGVDLYKKSFVIEELLRKAEAKGIDLNDIDREILSTGEATYGALGPFQRMYEDYINAGVVITGENLSQWQAEQDSRLMSPKYRELYGPPYTNN